MGELLTYVQVGQRLGGMTIHQVKYLIRKFGLPYVKLSPNNRRIDSDDLERFIKTNKYKQVSENGGGKNNEQGSKG